MHLGTLTGKSKMKGWVSGGEEAFPSSAHYGWVSLSILLTVVVWVYFVCVANRDSKCISYLLLCIKSPSNSGA